MILFSIKQLVQNLKENLITEKQFAIYLIIYNVLLLFPLFIFEFYPTNMILEILIEEDPYKYINQIEAALFLGIHILGTLWCYYKNNEGDKHNFLKRYISLYTPLGIRIYALLFLSSIGLSIIKLIYVPTTITPTLFNWLNTSINVSIQVFFFYWLSILINKVSLKISLK